MDSLTLSDAASAAPFSLIDQSDSRSASFSELPERPAFSFIAIHGEALLRNGYHPIPIQPGKKSPGQYHEGRWSGLREWSRFLAAPSTREDIAGWAAWPGAGIGLLTGNIIAVDNDILDEDLASKIVTTADDVLGKSPLLRIGREPKALLVYRAMEPMKKRTLGKVEILAEGQQFVAFGIHPDTKQPYRWVEQSPAEVSIDELPAVSQRDIDGFFEVLRPLLKVPAAPESKALTSVPKDGPGRSTVSGESCGYADIREAMKFISNADLHWEEWNRIGMALYQATAGAGFEIFDEWSRRSRKYDQKNTRERWEGIRRSPPNRIGDGLIFRLARGEGWRSEAPSVESTASSENKHLSDAAAKTSETAIKRAFRFLPSSEILDAPVAQTWLIKNVLEVGGLAMLVGESGVGKSFVVIDMAVSVALGESWLGSAVIQGPVFVIAGEGHSGFRNRLRAIEKHRNRSLVHAPLFFSNAAISLIDPRSVIEARTAIEKMETMHGAPALIIIDTLHRNAGGADENSAKDISAVLKEIDSKLRVFAKSCAVLIVHHSGHNDKLRARGSSSLYGAMDTELMLKRDGEDTVTLSVTKQKNHEPMRDITLKFQTVELEEVGEDGQPIKSRVVVRGDAVGGKARGKQLSGARLIGYRELERLLVIGQEPPKELQRELAGLCPQVVVHKRDWLRACVIAGISPKSKDAGRKAFNRMFNELNAAGLIKVWKELVWFLSTPILLNKTRPDIGTGQDK